MKLTLIGCKLYPQLYLIEIKQGLVVNERGKTAPVVENNSGSW